MAVTSPAAIHHSYRAVRPRAAVFKRRSVAKAMEPTVARPEVLSEDVFRDVLLREGKRTHRSAGLLALLLIEPSALVPAGSAAWQQVLDSIEAAKRETDMMGWLEEGRLLGVILTEITSRHVSVPRAIEGRVRRELARRLDARQAASLQPRIHVHYELDSEAPVQPDVAPVDVVLRTIRPVDRRTRLHRALKRALDIVGSLALLVLLAPVFVLIGAFVKLSSRGSVFFRQERIGEGAQPFEMLKFRTMAAGADSRIHQEFVTQFIVSETPGAKPDSTAGAPFKITNDPRVTPLGRWLRRTSLDELPQLWNVLRGEMSLVGPRPPLAYEVEQYKQWHHRRVLEAKPGMTGLWQVTGRSRTTFDEMVRLDLRYARKRSVWTDIKILLATPSAVVGGKGAA